MNMIQNDVDGVDQHLKAWVIITSSLVIYYS